MTEQHILLALAEADLQVTKAQRAKDRILAKVPEAEAGIQAADDLVKNRVEELARLNSEEKAAAREVQLYEKRKGTAIRALERGLGDPDAAQRQVEQCERIIEDLETRELELMEEAEQVEPQIEDAKRAAVQARAALDTVMAAQGDLLRAQEAIIHEQTGLRRLHYSQLPKELQNRYEMVRHKRGNAVSRMVDGYCRACQVRVPMAEASDIRRGLLKACRGCGRYLALDPS